MLQLSALAVWLVVIAAAYGAASHVFKRIDEESRIKQHGEHAPKCKSWIPLGLAFFWDITSYYLRDENLKFLHEYFFRAGRDTFEVRLLGTRWVFTQDPANVKAMLATQFGDFAKGDRFRKTWGELLGRSILTMDGQEWHDSRQLVRTYFTKQRFSDLECFERHVQELLPMLGEGKTVDFKDLIMRLTMDTSSEFTFGRSIGALHTPDAEFAAAFDALRHTQTLIERSGPFNGLVPRAAFRQHVATLKAFIQRSIEETLALSAAELADRDDAFLYSCAAANADPQVLLNEIMTILIAGRDTTALTLSFCFLELARHPDAVEELRAEIRDQLGFARAPTYDDLKALKAVQRALNETLRLYPPIPYNGRVAERDTSLPRGGGPDGDGPVGIPAGTTVIYSTHNMHLNPASYPPASEDFPLAHLWCPRRWERWHPEPWTYVPFSGGPRICTGQQFALAEMSFILVRVLQRFSRVELRMPDPAAAKAPDANRPWSRTSSGAPSLAEMYDAIAPRVASEILLSPRGPVNVAFFA